MKRIFEFARDTASGWAWLALAIVIWSYVVGLFQHIAGAVR